jgi:hypothetical protein
VGVGRQAFLAQSFMAQPSGGAATAKDAEEIEATRMLDSKIDAAEWKLELERVAPQVCIVQLSLVSFGAKNPIPARHPSVSSDSGPTCTST